MGKTKHYNSKHQFVSQVIVPANIPKNMNRIGRLVNKPHVTYAAQVKSELAIKTCLQPNRFSNSPPNSKAKKQNKFHIQIFIQQGYIDLIRQPNK